MTVTIGRRTLDDFTIAYIEAALWSTNDESDESGGVPMDDNYSIDDIADSSLADIVEDCRKFQEENAADIAALGDTDYCRQVSTADGRKYTGADVAGHNFWLTRCGHGVGFWDRDIGDLGDRLTAASEEFGSADIYVGDDGFVYYS